MKKKLILAAAGLLSIATLAACSSSTTGDKIVTYKGGSITVEDFYNKMKTDSNSQTTMANMVINQVFSDAYGDKVKDEEVDDKYQEYVDQYGDTWDDTLKNAGYTEKSFKAELKDSLAIEAGLRAHIELTDDDYKTAWDSFHPEVEAQIIAVASEEEATEIKKQLDDGGDFTEIAKEKSTDATKEDGGEIKFDSQTDVATVPAEVKTAAFALNDGDVSEVVSSMNTSTYQTTYYLVKMVKNEGKGNDMDAYKDELKTIAEENKLADQTFVYSVIGEELNKANVKIKDDAFADALSTYTDAFETSTSSTEDEANSSSDDTENTDSSEADSSAADSSAADSSAQESTDSSN